MGKPPKDENEIDQADADHKRDEALLRALSMPPEPHKAAKVRRKPRKGKDADVHPR